MELTVKAIIAGVALVILVLQCGLASGKPLTVVRQEDPMCQNAHLCKKEKVLNQIRCQVSRLNMTAQHLFDFYLKCQSNPFDDKQKLDKLCPSNNSFPPFPANQTINKEMLVALYKIAAFLNASLGNISRDQKDLTQNASLLERLNNTTDMTQGLLSNLSCLLCSVYKVPHVDVVYGKSSDKESTFLKKQQGCQVLRWYKGVVARAAHTLGPCSRQE